MKSNKLQNEVIGSYDMELGSTRDDKDRLCGLGGFHPAFLQVFARIGAFVGIYSISGLLTSSLTIYVNSQVSMLEKQFGFSSSETGVLMSCNDIGYLSCVIFAGYIARKIHIPRGLGISTILFGVCGILCALPYFLTEKSMYSLESSSALTNTTRKFGGKPVPMCLNTSILSESDGCSDKNSSEMTYNMEKLWIKKMAFALIAIGMVFQGLGKSTRYPFVTLYIDDAVDKKKTGFYMGILTGTGILGPALAYLLGGLFSKIYVTLEAVDITPSDPRWIGAWWLGFLVFGGCSLVFSVPLMCFPRKLSRRQEIPADRMKKKLVSKKAAPNAFLKEMKHMLQSVLRVLSNPVFNVVSISSCINMIGVAGTISFMPKYLASQFSVPLWKANILMAVSNLLAVSLGSFFGGILTRKFAMTPQSTMKILSVFYLFTIAFYSTGYIIGCDQPSLVGGGNNGIQRSPSTLYTSIESQCHDGCLCDDNTYFPICGEDGQSYYSPCHAGCSNQNKMSFSNCTCIPSGKAVSGLCDQGCTTKLYIYAVFTFLSSICAAIKIVPLMIVKLRCVAEKDRAVSTALAGFFMSAIGWMPGPIIFGLLIDGTCTLWKYACEERLSCQLYNIVNFRIAIHSFGLVTKGIAFLMILGLYIYFRVTKQEKWRKDDPKGKEVLINGENKVDTNVYRQIPNQD